MRNISTLIFDLDGTISDPSQGIKHCLNYAFENHNLPAVSSELVATRIGPPLDETFLEFCPDADKSMIASLVASYRARYTETGYAENQLYPSITDALENFSSRGIRMGVCTSKRKDFAVKILTMFGILPHFHFVSGGDVGIKKREQLSSLLQSGEINRSAAMIGDREVDISSARANGLRSAGVLWGFGDLNELSNAGADIVLSNTSELEKLGA